MSVKDEASPAPMPDLPLELAAWREHWQSVVAAMPAPSATAAASGTSDVSSREPGALTASTLRERVERESRRLKLLVAGDVLVTLVMGGGATAWALRDPRPAVMVLAAAVWTFITAAWLFGLTNRRGTWAPASIDTTAFLDLSIRRCRGSLATMRFGLLLGSVELLFSLAWVYQELASREPLSLVEFLTSRALLIVWTAGAAAILGLLLYGRRKRAELAWLVDLRRQLTGVHGQDDEPRTPAASETAPRRPRARRRARRTRATD